LEDDTLVIFSSDNGGQGGPWQRLTDFFEGNGPLRGYKGQFYEGGIRVPLIARCPGRVRAGSVSEHACAFWDVLPTLAEAAGATPPKGLDGISFLPALLGKGEQRTHDLVYWAYPFPRGLVQAARAGDWKLVRPGPGRPFELYDLKADPGESKDVAGAHPEVVARIKARMAGARTEGRKPRPERAPTIKDFVR